MEHTIQKRLFLFSCFAFAILLTACTIYPVENNLAEVKISNFNVFAIKQRNQTKSISNTVYFTFETNIDLDLQAKALRLGNTRLDSANTGRTHSKLGTITADIYTAQNTEYKKPHEIYIPKTIPTILSNGNFQYVGWLLATDSNWNSYLNEVKENGGITFNLVLTSQFTKYKFGSGFLKLTLEQLGIS